MAGRPLPLCGQFLEAGLGLGLVVAVLPVQVNDAQAVSYTHLRLDAEILQGHVNGTAQALLVHLQVRLEPRGG